VRRRRRGEDERKRGNAGFVHGPPSIGIGCHVSDERGKVCVLYDMQNCLVRFAVCDVADADKEGNLDE